MGDWKIVSGNTSTRNKVLNPQVGVNDHFSAYGAGAATQYASASRGYSKFGGWSFRAITTGAGDGLEVDCIALTHEPHYVIAFMRGAGAAAIPTIEWSVDDANWHTPTLLLQIDEYWALYGEWFPSGQCNGNTSIIFKQTSAGVDQWYTDGVMITVSPDITDGDSWYLYVDGEQVGCLWDGSPHESTSRASGWSRHTGSLLDLEDDLGLEISGMIGVGTPTYDLKILPYALRAGGTLTAKRATTRAWSLVGTVRGTTWETFHEKRQDLDGYLRSEHWSQNERRIPPAYIWYTGAEIVKELAAYYEGGLELTHQAPRDKCYVERLALRFSSPDPVWREIGEGADHGNVEESFTAFYIARRNRATTWDEMDVGAAVGGAPIVYAIVRGSDNKIYVGGSFTSLDGVGANIAVYDPSAGTWAALGGGLNAEVRGLAFGPDGTLYAVGLFTVAGGDGDADYVAQIDPDAGVPAWSAVGIPDTGGITEIYAVAVDHDGNIIVGGDFINLAGIGDADRAAYWDGAAWQSFGNGFDNGIVYAVAVGIDGTIWFGGSFTTHDGDTRRRIMGWDGSASVDLNGGCGDGIVYAIAPDRAGGIFVGGTFTQVDNTSTDADYIAYWDGNIWYNVGADDELDGAVRALAIGPDDMLWVGGAFTAADTLPIANGIARFVGTPSGGSWAAADIDLPGTATVYVLAVGQVDPDRTRFYDLYAGFDTTGTAYTATSGFGGVSSMTARAYPSLILKRSGGTSAILVTLRSLVDGDELHFNYALQDGETVTIDLNPDAASFMSDFYGNRDSAILPSSDLGRMSLSDGGNWTVFVREVGAPTMVCYLLSRRAFAGVD